MFVKNEIKGFLLYFLLALNLVFGVGLYYLYSEILDLKTDLIMLITDNKQQMIDNKNYLGNLSYGGYLENQNKTTE